MADEPTLEQIMASPSYPPPGTVCPTCGHVNHRGEGWDGASNPDNPERGIPSEAEMADRDPNTRS